jgi:hypothetical protein
MQIKTKLRFHLTHSEWQSSRTQTTNDGEDGGERKFIHCWWEYKLVYPLWKSIWRFLKELKVELSFEPAIPHLNIFLKEYKPTYNRDSSTIYDSQAKNQPTFLTIGD